MKRTKRVYLNDMKLEEAFERLIQGDELYYDNDINERLVYKLVKGVLCTFDEDGLLREINGSLYSPDLMYFEDVDNKLQLELGKRYRTRSGDRVVCFRTQDCCCYPYSCLRIGTGDVHRYTEKGSFILGKEHELDIVAEWED